MLRKVQTFWQLLRRLSGDDAYERYIAHFAEHHQHEGIHVCEKPLTKKAFFKKRQDERWNGINRCC